MRENIIASTACSFAGVMDEAAVRSLKEVSGSQGLMLESSSLRLLQPGGPHHNCPDKVHICLLLACVIAVPIHSIS